MRHINTGHLKFVNLQGNPFEILSKGLLSPTKGNYEIREECIKNVVEINTGHTFLLCMPDPDVHKTNPHEPVFTLI